VTCHTLLPTMHNLPYPTRAGVALVAVGDPARDRTVYATILLLVALGLALIMLAVWLVRNTRPDPDVLAPLERMGERKWRSADPVWQHRSLDEVRPREAKPLEPSSAPPATDAEFERGPQPIGFDDLVASSTITVDGASGLPAPLADALPVEGPIGVGDDGDAVSGDDAVADDSGSEAADAIVDEEAVADTDDDDEDITGEQDGDDFLAVLDPAHVDLDLDLDFDDDPGLEVDRDASDSDPAIDAIAEPDAEPDVEADAGPDAGPDLESGPGHDADADGGPDADNDEDVVRG
jgi:hypothetical protein